MQYLALLSIVVVAELVFLFYFLKKLWNQHKSYPLKKNKKGKKTNKSMTSLAEPFISNIKIKTGKNKDTVLQRIDEVKGNDSFEYDTSAFDTPEEEKNNRA